MPDIQSSIPVAPSCSFWFVSASMMRAIGFRLIRYAVRHDLYCSGNWRSRDGGKHNYAFALSTTEIKEWGMSRWLSSRQLEFGLIGEKIASAHGRQPGTEERG